MKNRLTHDFIKEVKDLSSEIDEFKSTQLIGGASFVNYTTFSESSFDLSVTVGSGSFAVRRLTFVSDEPEKFNIIRPSIFFRLNDSNVMGNPQEPGENFVVRATTESPITGYSWIVQLVNGTVGSQTFFVKFFFKGTVSGTFNVTTV